MGLNKVPLPIGSIALAIATLGGVYDLYGIPARLAFGAISFLLLALPSLKLLCVRGQLREVLSSPILSTVVGTFSMALIVLSGYLVPFSWHVAFAVFLLGTTLHTVLIAWFTYRFLFRIPIQKMVTTWLILYVGYASVCIVSPAFGLGESLGLWVFWFSFAMCLVLVPLLLWRYIVVRAIPEPEKPFICIFTAPAALSLVAYLKIATPPAAWFVWTLGVLMLVGLFVVIGFLPKLLSLPFYPSYAAFTFPFVISAMAGRCFELYLANEGVQVCALHWVAMGQTVLATGLTAYALIRFAMASARKA